MGVPDELTEREVRGRAAALIQKCGWKPGDRLHGKAVLDLMTSFGLSMLTEPPQDRCAHPECGCDADAVCEATARKSRAVRPCHWGGGNDIIWCSVCGAEYAYAKGERRPPCPRLSEEEDTAQAAAILRKLDPAEAAARRAALEDVRRREREERDRRFYGEGRT